MARLSDEIRRRVGCFYHAPLHQRYNDEGRKSYRRTNRIAAGVELNSAKATCIATVTTNASIAMGVNFQSARLTPRVSTYVARQMKLIRSLLDSLVTAAT